MLSEDERTSVELSKASDAWARLVQATHEAVAGFEAMGRTMEKHLADCLARLTSTDRASYEAFLKMGLFPFDALAAVKWLNAFTESRHQ